MGSSQAIGGDGICCDMGLKCWCKWRLRSLGFSSTASMFFMSAFLFLCSIVTIYFWMFYAPVRSFGRGGCLEDNEGSWSIGVFYGDTPFDLRPVEDMNVWRNESAAWPVANPVLTCGSVSEAGVPSNFVADPFLFVQGDTLYMFYETKNSVTAQGDIGVAKSVDNGATWEPLGIALDEDWHLSFPYVFEYQGEIFMIPESSQKMEVRLYRAVTFPLQWTLEKIILKKPLVDSVIVFHDGLYWLFGSHHSHFGLRTTKLEIWYSSSPLGVWNPHKKNPVYNNYRNVGTRNGGRPFIYNGGLYRISQEAGEAYGRGVHISKVEVLTKDEFREVEVPLHFVRPKKGRNAWNGVRHHHMDVQKLSNGKWIAAMDGDRVLSGDLNYRIFVGATYLGLDAGLVIFLGVLLGAVKFHMPLYSYRHDFGKRSDFSSSWDRTIAVSSKFRRFYSRLNKSSISLRGILNLKSHTGRLLLVLMFLLIATLMCAGIHYIYGGSSGQEAYPVNGQYSQFTLLTMTYDARLWNLKMCIQHYSRCPSVREIVVVWNKGTPPNTSDFDSAVPVRIRAEKQNSLNNRFRLDRLLKTRAVLELDDDIMMTCEEIERGFKVWREHPDQLVGYYPRLIKGSPLKYRGEKFARTYNGYNMILTGAAFMDASVAFERYWSEAAKAGREMVDRIFNCEDVLMNYLYNNASSSSRAVQYVRSTWAIDTSKFSSAAISRNTNVHYEKRSECLEKFAELYGSLANKKWEFNSRGDGWDT